MNQTLPSDKLLLEDIFTPTQWLSVTAKQQQQQTHRGKIENSIENLMHF